MSTNLGTSRLQTEIALSTVEAEYINTVNSYERPVTWKSFVEGDWRQVAIVLLQRVSNFEQGLGTTQRPSDWQKLHTR